jgi:hypothetical protein
MQATALSPAGGQRYAIGSAICGRFSRAGGALRSLQKRLQTVDPIGISE